MTPEEFQALNEKHPYLTYVKFMDEHLIGIIQNLDNQLVSIYVYNDIDTEQMRKRFLELGKVWWEQSNQTIPINIFLREDFKPFNYTLKCLPKKDVSDIRGPTINLEQNFQKRIKRKRIQLIRNPNNNS